MATKVTNKELLAAINNLALSVQNLNARVSALEEGTSSKVSAKKSSDKKTSKKPVKSTVVDLADFEPKKDEEGFFIWASYKTNRACYAYNKLGVKTWKGAPQWKEGQKADFDWDAFNELKAEFGKHFQYIKKADR